MPFTSSSRSRLRVVGGRVVRVTLGSLLVVGGFFGFLPILGFWMLPLGLLILSSEFSFMRRARRRLVIRWGPSIKRKAPAAWKALSVVRLARGGGEVGDRKRD